jgi:hypothetical protein
VITTEANSGPACSTHTLRVVEWPAAVPFERSERLLLPISRVPLSRTTSSNSAPELDPKRKIAAPVSTVIRLPFCVREIGRAGAGLTTEPLVTIRYEALERAPTVAGKLTSSHWIGAVASESGASQRAVIRKSAGTA